MECPIPSPGPYAHLDYVVKVHFVEEEARVVHIMQTDTNQREYVVTTTSTLMRNGLGNGGEPPALTYCVPPSHWMQFLGQYFFPILLGPKKCFGTHCRASYQFLHRIVPQQAVWMEFQLASHFSSHLHILTMYCKVRKDRELQHSYEAWQKKKRATAVAADTATPLPFKENVDWKNASAARNQWNHQRTLPPIGEEKNDSEEV
ncbi:hypothetical protein JTE90_017161 [Oedothorax gibbosus]|uniref:Uncharacterized protein n=1 Tax=Oedothorax gibbosus TaxID=931172 RepID=A0AAV6TGV2_9ARAC|nr:hypothetical protein JTE90_002523 [Oedothorax gibbosus]KAG8171055.1 hypothetical protein JTE90_002525 [Oedothorax gibbosus]KAG8172347.1 hypothetical protein JTE90_017161 [Oedothorax gibbosus]